MRSGGQRLRGQLQGHGKLGELALRHLPFRSHRLVMARTSRCTASLGTAAQGLGRGTTLPLSHVCVRAGKEATLHWGGVRPEEEELFAAGKGR